MSTISTLPERRRVGHTANVPAAYGPRPPRRRRPPPTQRRPRSEEESEGGASSSSPTHGLFNRARDFAIEGGTFNAVEAGGVVFMNYHPQTRRQIRRLVRERRHDPHQPAASPSTRAPPKSESKIYHDQLITKCRGTPLWIPGPNKRLPRAYRREGTNIGDVGMVTDLGSFRFLFNIFEEATSDINGGMVPDGFVPLRLTASEGARLASRAVEEFKLYTDKSWIGEGVDEEVTSSAGGFTFTTHASEGAILMMPHGATSKDFTMQNLLKHYVATHLENWYQYVNHRCHHDAKNGELRLVSGCDKTSSWGIATFRHQESTLALQGAKRMHFKPDRQGDGKTYVWSCLTGGSGRVGPAESELMDLVDIGDSTATETNNEGQHRRGGQIENQCLFIRTINAMCGAAQKRRIWGDVAMVAADDPEVTHQHLGNSARPGNQSMSQDGQLSAGSSVWGADSQSIWQTGIQFTHMDGQPTPNIHPSDLLNNALLEMHPEANIVVSEDADWMDTTCWCRTTLTQANLLHFKEVEVKDGVLSLERFSPKVLQNMPKMRFIRTGIPHPLYNSVRTNLRVVVSQPLSSVFRNPLLLLILFFL
ncbi:hypothetical protein CPB83DRAFT_502993 [Crepidotus variabilis]|uniref:Uncharacterized protein n=1 Tax=Crepidotus variabilis TaxID=179855 RepID=A0A9P6EBP5_9AGAR|nr:hypothetical protein CPB83DRAFT_502993 [Crepidotus variabilis]